MCHWITIKATTETGETHPGICYETVWEGDIPDTELCTCCLQDGHPAEQVEQARDELMLTLAPYLNKVAWGNIVIEVR